MEYQPFSTWTLHVVPAAIVIACVALGFFAGWLQQRQEEEYKRMCVRSQRAAHAIERRLRLASSDLIEQEKLAVTKEVFETRSSIVLFDTKNNRMLASVVVDPTAAYKARDAIFVHLRDHGAQSRAKRAFSLKDDYLATVHVNEHVSKQLRKAA